MLERLKLKSISRYIMCICVVLFALLSALICLPIELFYPSVFIAVFLAWMSFVDIERHILPNLLNYTLIVSGLIWASVFKLDILYHHVIGAITGYAALALVSWVHLKRKGIQGMGMGDAKLFAAAGAWMGWIALPYIMLIAAFSGLVWVAVKSVREGKLRRDVRIAFGPHIAFGFWIVWLLEISL